MMLSPWFWIAVLVSAMSLFGGGYYLGDEHATNACAAEKLELTNEANQAAIEQASEDQQTAQQYEESREKVRTVYIKVKEKARENVNKNPTYDHCGLDDDGLRLYNSRPDAATPSTSGPHSALPGSSSSAGRKIVNYSAEQLGALTDVLRLPREAQSAIELGEQLKPGGIGGTGKTQKMTPEDRAQELELLEYQATQNRAIAITKPSLSHCEDCGEKIPLERQKIGGMTRCVLCQEGFEVLAKQGRSYG